MPFATHLRLTMTGNINDRSSPAVAVEQFTYRLNLSSPTVAQDDFTFDRAQDYAADAVAFHGSAGAFISNNAILTEVKLARIGTDGKYLEDPFLIEVNQPGGAAIPSPYPPQIAHAVSLMTARRGATGKGRFYLPLPSAGLQLNLGYSAAAAEAVRGAVVVFIDNINNTPGLDGVSPKVTIASTKGYNSDVTGVRVGLALDTIRSRRASLEESYTSVSAIA